MLFRSPPAQWTCQRSQLLDFTRAKQLGIIIQRNAAEGQRVAHVFLLSRSISRSNLERALSKVLCKYQCGLRCQREFATPARRQASARSRWSAAGASIAKK